MEKIEFLSFSEWKSNKESVDFSEYLDYVISCFNIKRELPYYIFNHRTLKKHFIKKDNRIYAKSNDSIFYTLFFNPDNSKIKSDFLCPCGNMSFYITYGNYEIFAQCPDCGNEDSIYNG